MPRNKKYSKLNKHTDDLLAELEEKLSKEQMKFVNKFHCHIIDIHRMEVKA